MRVGVCPICGARDAFVDTLRDGDEYYVECVNCGVYRARRRAFRLFQYLRDRADPESLGRLDRLAKSLSSRARGVTAYLEYNTWELESRR
jgi:Zn ribbon nucleic-acid-binding protein